MPVTVKQCEKNVKELLRALVARGDTGVPEKKSLPDLCHPTPSSSEALVARLAVLETDMCGVAFINGDFPV